MRIFKYKRFCRWAKSEDVSDEDLKQAIAEVERGLYEANLGAGLYKKRIAKKGQGKRDGYRTFIAFKLDHMAIFIYGFAKNEKDNVGAKETEIYKKLAKYFLSTTSSQLYSLIRNSEFFEVIL